MLGGVAIAGADEGLIAEVRLNVRSTHSERLMGAIAYVLSQSDCAIEDLDAFAVSVGPGSFTGLRIGLSTAKGLAYATGRPLVAIPTFEAFARHFLYVRQPVCLMLDARKNEVYAAVFIWEGGAFRQLMPETTVRPADLLKTIRGETIFAGEGALLYKDLIRATLGDLAVFASPERMVPSAADAAVLALQRAGEGAFVPPEVITPRYIRKSEAEEKWEQAHPLAS